MWATFLTFQKVLKSVWAGGSPLNLDNAQKIGCFFWKSSPLERKLFLGAISSSCQKTHRTLVFSKKRWSILVSHSPCNVLNILHPREVSTPYPVTASYQQSYEMQQRTKEMGASMTLHTFMPQHLLLLMMRCAFSWGKISCGFTPMHRGINQLISHRMVMNKRKLYVMRVKYSRDIWNLAFYYRNKAYLKHWWIVHMVTKFHRDPWWHLLKRDAVTYLVTAPS